jgi:hypothetical protein
MLLLIFWALPTVIKCQAMLSLKTDKIGCVCVASLLFIVDIHPVIWANDVYHGVTKLPHSWRRFLSVSLEFRDCARNHRASVLPRKKIRPLWWVGSDTVVLGIKIKCGQSMFFSSTSKISKRTVNGSRKKALPCVKKYVQKVWELSKTRRAAHKVISIAGYKWTQIAVESGLRKQWSWRFSSDVEATD